MMTQATATQEPIKEIQYMSETIKVAIIEDLVDIALELQELLDTQFCMFTVFEDNQKIYKSLMAGAKGYILKNTDPDRIIKRNN